MHMCGVCLRAISGGKSETFKSVGSRYKAIPVSEAVYAVVK